MFTRRSRLYSLVVMTSGVYAFFWSLALMRSIESLSGAEKFHIDLYKRMLVWFLMMYIFAIFYSISHIGDPGTRAFSPLWVLLMAAMLLGFAIFLVVRIHWAIGRLTPTRKRRSTPAIVGLTLFFFASLPVLQAEVDALLSDAGAGGARPRA
jgi:hypothetical protein